MTDAARGIGRAAAEAFVAAGATVIGIVRDVAAARSGFATRVCDLRDGEALDRQCETLLADGAPEVLVHTAGILRLGGLKELSAADWTPVKQ